MSNQNKTKKCPKYYRINKITDECEFQEKKTFKINSDGLIEIPEEFRDMVIKEKGEEYFKENYENISDKEKKKGKIKGIIFTSNNATRKKRIISDTANIPITIPIKKPKSKIETDKVIKEITIVKYNAPKINPKKIRIKKSDKTIEIKQPNIINILREQEDTKDAYVSQLTDYDPAVQKIKSPEIVNEQPKAHTYKELKPITENIEEKIPSDDELNYDFLYPSLDDPNFNIKLAKHKEFFDTKYDGSIHDFKTYAEKMCNIDFELSPNQIFVKNFLSTNTPYNGLLLYAGLGTGKCHKKDTPILLYDGSIKKVQDIEIGDLLMGDDSSPRKVLSLARGKDKMYDIIPIKGDKYTVNEEHILCLRVSGYPKLFKSKRGFEINWIENNKYRAKSFSINENKDASFHKTIELNAKHFYGEILKNTSTNNNIIEISVKDYLKLSKKKKANLKGYKVPVDFTEKELPFDPYMIGYWLGDGCCSTPEISCKDSTVLYYFTNNLHKYDLSLTYYSGYNYGITANKGVNGNNFLNTLKKLNIYNNKHIPMIYKCNSKKNRLELLAGLIDSDGYLDPNSNCFEFTQKNEKLIDDVIYIARSLGFSCYKKLKKTSWTYKGVKNYGQAFRIFINGEGIEEIPTKIPRKQSKSREQIKNVLVTGITVKYVNEDDYYGFTLNGNCRYLMGDFTVTHNTCSAIGVAEEMRSYMKQIGMRKQILIIASPNVQDNFRLQLFDESKLKFENGIWKINSCIGKKLLEEINPTNMEIPKERIISQVKSIIKNYYYFMGYTQFANYINESVELKGFGYSKEEKLKMKIKKIKNVFNNRLIIIDEVHNIRITHENKNRKTAELLMEVAKYADNMRLLLLSATPMYNSHEEIIWLTNLLNQNDKRSTIKIANVFKKNGDFIENGRDLLVRKLTGYVSHVRGENPYTFPFRIYSDENSFKNNKYPTMQMNGKKLDPKKAIKYIPLFLNNIGEHQQVGYKFIIENMKAKNNNELAQKETYDIMNDNLVEMDSFGYTVLQYPLEALNIVYPNDTLYDPNTKIENTEENYQIISNIVGSQGLHNVMRFKDKTENDKILRYNFDYIYDKYGRIFAPENIGKYSSKISKICDIIRKSEGIIMIYSQWIDSGLVPMALALEEMGFTKYGSENYTKPLLKNPAEPIDSITMKTKQDLSITAPEHSFHQAKYVMITGDISYSPNNDADIKYLNQPKNKDGKYVKVVLISKAAAEGIDFKNIRQIHIMEPWYNMNRIEQIIGRGVRNYSHCLLPFEKRNVEIFLHATLAYNNEESSDLYVYRLAELKSTKIGRITRLLKETAIDCILNISQTNFTSEKLIEMGKNQTVEIITSSGKKIKYNIGDQPHTPICDYMDNCNYTCSPNMEINDSNIIKTTYNDNFLQNNHDIIIKRIRDLFIDIPGQREGKMYYSEEELINSINIIKTYPIEQIYSALTYLIENKHEYITDRYGRLGNLINKDKYYLFQPIEITDDRISIYEREHPVDVKHPSILVDFSKIEMISEPKSNIPSDTINIFQTLLSKFEINFNAAFATDKKIISGDKNWYNNMSVVVKHLNEQHNISLENLQKYVIDHIIDEIPFNEKMIILNEIYFNWKPMNILETYIKEYFNDRIVTSEQGLIGMVLSEDNKKTQIFIQSKTNPKQWEKAEFTDSNVLIRSKSYSEKYIFNKNILNDIIGFMSWVDNQQEYVFKIRDLNDSVNKKGARVNQALIKDIIIKINSILGINYYTNENVKEFFGEGKNRLVVILEILIREFQENKRNNKIWFLNNEQILINGILNYTKKI